MVHFSVRLYTVSNLSHIHVFTVLQRHIGANRFFFLSLTFWGLASLSVVYAKGYAGLLVLRYDPVCKMTCHELT